MTDDELEASIEERVYDRITDQALGQIERRLQNLESIMQSMVTELQRLLPVSGANGAKRQKRKKAERKGREKFTAPKVAAKSTRKTSTKKGIKKVKKAAKRKR